MTEVPENSKPKKPEEKPIEPQIENEKESRDERGKSSILSDTVLIGVKPVMSYVTAVMMHFSSGSRKLVLKARGRAISKAVDVIEVSRRRFFQERLRITSITIGTETIGEGGDTRNVSTIEIAAELVK
jgi:DNA-binding protein